MNLSTDQIFVFFFQSIGIFMSAFFFIQYSIIRRKEHFYYAVYLLLLWVYLFLAMPEYFFSIKAIAPGDTDWFNLFKRPVQYLSSIFYTWFVIYYLGLETTRFRAHRIFRILIIIYALASVSCLVLNYLKLPYDSYYFLFSLLLLPIQIYVLVALFRERIRYSYFIIWGSLITIVGSLTALLLTILYKNYPGDYPLLGFRIFFPVQLCIMIDMFLYTIALQKKMADLEKSLVDAAFQRQQAIALERERIIADLHDDVGGGLSSIRMMSDLMLQQGGLEKSQTSFAERISLTARDIAHRMHTIIWSLNQENDRLSSFLEYVRQYGASFFEGSPVDFSLDVSLQEEKDIQLNGTLRKNLFLIVKEGLHNILKHAGATRAQVTFEYDGQHIRLCVADNGKGIEHPESVLPSGFGNGLRNMYKRAEEIGGRLTLESGKGLKICVTVPMN